MACVVRQQGISWANVDPDLCRQMTSLRHDEFNRPVALLPVEILQRTRLHHIQRELNKT